MHIVNTNPPNFQKIHQALNPPPHAIYAYGDTIYNPSGQEIYPDLEIHEEVHQKQQEQYTSVELWWNRYLLDKVFREEMEVEAYHTQLQFLKGKMPDKAIKELLREMSENLSKNYNLDLTTHQAESRIRLYNK